jgi:N-succinyldiaminopimelate aminotransferase
MKQRSTRVSGLGTTIFARMSVLAQETGSVNLGQGFPDTDGPHWVIEAAVEALRTGHNQYAPGTGVLALRQAIAAHQQRFYDWELDPDREVAVTTGATEAIAAALLGLVDPGDEVIALEPYYDSYVACIQMAGGIRRPVTLRAPAFRLDVDELRAAVGERTRVLLLNTPHNPTGTVLSPAELQAVADGGDRARPGRDQRRGLRAPHLRRREARSRRHAARHGRADADHLVVGQDLLVHRLEDRVGVRTRVPGAGDDGGQAVHDLHLRGSAAAGDSGRPRRAAARSSPRSRPSSRPAATSSGAGLAALGFGRARAPRGTVLPHHDIRSLGADDGMQFCLELPERAAWSSPSRTRCLRRQGRRRAARAVGVLQARTRDRPGAGAPGPVYG